MRAQSFLAGVVLAAAVAALAHGQALGPDAGHSLTITCNNEGCHEAGAAGSISLDTRGDIRDYPVDAQGWVKGGFTNDPAVLCVNGRPAPRRPHVTYGGFRLKPGFERDHVCPLGLGCPDTADNMQYQAYDGTAQAKNRREHKAEEDYCRNPSPELLDTLRAQFKRDARP